MRSSWWWLW